MNAYMLAARVIHILAAVYNILFVYSSLHEWQHGFEVVQYISMPLLILTGVIMVRARKARTQKA